MNKAEVYMPKQPSFRSQFVFKRTYNRPLNEEGTKFETFEDTINRVIGHQKWLWIQAKKNSLGVENAELTKAEKAELQELKGILMRREASLSGRTNWLGGTEISKTFQATNFNCAFEQVRTVHDVVDAFHNLLLGVGQGFEPIVGTLNGFASKVEFQIIRSTRKDRGKEGNSEKLYYKDGKRYWHLTVGDSGTAWAKAAGKLLAMKHRVDVVVLDFSEVRPGGQPLKGFGWISSGDEQISEAFEAIAKILSLKHGQLLSRMNILDILNWLGTSLSSRRSAEIALIPSDDAESAEFAMAKKDYWTTGNKQRGQSNNSVMYEKKPSKIELQGLFSMMLASGGSEPGIINAEAAIKKAPWFKGVNPCAI